MKKINFSLLIVALIVVSIIGIRYYSYMIERNNLLKENAEYEKYLDSEIYGIDLATLINKTINQNEKNEVEKDENSIYIQNDENSINIEIYMQDNETTYKMEAFYNAGTEQFLQYYSNVKFKCTKIEYHKNTGRVKYMLFEQLQTS